MLTIHKRFILPLSIILILFLSLSVVSASDDINNSSYTNLCTMNDCYSDLDDNNLCCSDLNDNKLLDSNDLYSFDSTNQKDLSNKEKQSNDNPVLSNLKKEKKQVDASLANLLRAIEQGVVSKTTTARLHELENKQEELERKILTEESKKSMILGREEVEAFYVDALKKEAKLIIEILIKEIVLYNDRIKIYLNSPTKNGPDENRGFSFYHRILKSSDLRKYPTLLSKESVILDMRV